VGYSTPTVARRRAVKDIDDKELVDVSVGGPGAGGPGGEPAGDDGATSNEDSPFDNDGGNKTTPQ
jgi:hypothetical protein